MTTVRPPPGNQKPSRTMPWVTMATPGVASAPITSSMRWGISFSPNTCAVRSTNPCPAATQTTASPARTRSARKSHTSSEPGWVKGRGATPGRNVVTSPASSESREIQGRGATAAISWSWERKSPESTSTGAWPPAIAAASQAALKNSRFVCCRVSARAATFWEESSMTVQSVGKKSLGGTSPGTNSGCRASIPSTGIPSAIFSSMASKPLYSPWSCRARERTSSVSNISLTGGITTSPAGSSRERWSATAKYCRVSISEPKKSKRTGCSASGGNTSTIPPRTAYSPRLVTKSTRT